MITKETYTQIVGALKEQNKKQTIERKAGKQHHKAIQRIITKYTLEHGSYYWNKPDFKKAIKEIGTMDYLTTEQMTLFHIFYNRLRNRKAHTGTYESDQAYINEYNGTWAGLNFFGKLVKEVQEKYDVKLKDTGEIDG